MAQVTVGSITFYVCGRQKTLQNVQTEKDTRLRVLTSKHQAKSHFSGLPPHVENLDTCQARDAGREVRKLMTLSPLPDPPVYP